MMSEFNICNSQFIRGTFAPSQSDTLRSRIAHTAARTRPEGFVVATVVLHELDAGGPTWGSRTRTGQASPQPFRRRYIRRRSAGWRRRWPAIPTAAPSGPAPVADGRTRCSAALSRSSSLSVATSYRNPERTRGLSRRLITLACSGLATGAHRCGRCSSIRRLQPRIGTTSSRTSGGTQRSSRSRTSPQNGTSSVLRDSPGRRRRNCHLLG